MKKVINEIEYQTNRNGITLGLLRYIVPQYFDVYVTLMLSGGKSNGE